MFILLYIKFKIKKEGYVSVIESNNKIIDENIIDLISNFIEIDNK